mmetsp:Transcript_58518/g.124106  ORF Transcript_58518/g.124106 Transcript_58518/m.124106 type:complete len:237 (+) Transcript_58518:1849-2559(+)
MVSQETRLHEIHQSPQIAQLVLERSAREQKSRLGLDSAQGPASAGRRVLDLLSFVHEKNIPWGIGILRHWSIRRDLVLGLAGAVVVAASPFVLPFSLLWRCHNSRSSQASSSKVGTTRSNEIVGNQKHSTSGDDFLHGILPLLLCPLHDKCLQACLLGPLLKLPLPLFQQGHWCNHHERRRKISVLQASQESSGLHRFSKTHLIGQDSPHTPLEQVPHPYQPLSLVVVQSVMHLAR